MFVDSSSYTGLHASLWTVILVLLTKDFLFLAVFHKPPGNLKTLRTLSASNGNKWYCCKYSSKIYLSVNPKKIFVCQSTIGGMHTLESKVSIVFGEQFATWSPHYGLSLISRVSGSFVIAVWFCFFKLWIVGIDVKDSCQEKSIEFIQKVIWREFYLC